jgi:murein DD-endopeptidase MepM/ murein hydrolase activator NlpD
MNLKTLIIGMLTGLFLPSVGHATAATPNVYWEENDQGRVVFYADNEGDIPQWVDIRLSPLKNLNPSRKPPFTFNLKPHSKRAILFKLRPKRGRGYNFEVTTRFIPGGDPARVRHDNSQLYLLPFEHGTKHKLGQGYFGKATHKKPNPYALDFNMDVGTPVHAARKGIVAEVKEDSNVGGPSPKYALDGNHVLIYHYDNTFASYVHLKKNGALVKVGDRVVAGQKIGLSGNTGQSSGPHLHFEVHQHTADGGRRNLPVSFVGHDKTRLSRLEEGQFYYSTVPGESQYQVVLGQSLKNERFGKIDPLLTPTPKTDKLEVITREVDDAIVLFALNGKDATIEVELDLQLVNFKPSKKAPLTVSVPPLREKFLLFLQPVDSTKAGQYGYSFKQRVVSRFIDDDDYRSHRVIVPKTNKMKIRKANVDANVLLYARNGFSTSKVLTLKLEVVNMRASKGRTLKVPIPPLTEIYLQHVRPISPMNAYKLSYSYGWQ